VKIKIFVAYWDLPTAKRNLFFFSLRICKNNQHNRFTQMTKDGQNSKDTFTDAASLTTITVATTAFSFLGAFMLRDVFQSIFEKIEKKFSIKDRNPGWKLLWTLFTFAIVVLILVWLASLKKRQLENQEKVRVEQEKTASGSGKIK